MKPFDLALAKAGHPVMTRLGEEARIVCFDVAGSTNYPLLVLVKDCDGNEYTCQKDLDGKSKYDEDHDLFMKTQKRERWVIFDYDRKIMINNKVLYSKSEADQYAEQLGLSLYSAVLVGQWWED